MSAINLVAITSIILHGRIIEPDTEFACEYSHAKKLVDGGSARLKSDDSLKNDENVDENSAKTLGNTGVNGDQTPPDNTDLKDKLDDLTVPKLKELAKKHEIQLDSDDKKEQIIEKIIALGVNIDEENV